MGRREEEGDELELEANVPSFFRCPISLDVMKSPVSLCTGVTYDRSSIQPWLDTGHNTCPATMQVLPTTDVVPNHNLHRLIQLWSARSRRRRRQQAARPRGGEAPSSPRDLLGGLLDQGLGDPLTLLRNLAEVAVNEVKARELAEDDAFIPAVNGILARGDLGLEEMEAATRALSPVLHLRKAGDARIDRLLADPRTVSPLLAVLKAGSVEGRVDAARVLTVIASAGGTENKLLVAETEGVLVELLRLVGEEEKGKPLDERAVDAGLSCLVAISSPRRVRPLMVRAGAVAVLGKLLSRPSATTSAAEMALKLMEAASTCTEGRAAVCENPDALTAVVGKMMKVSAAGTEHAVAVLWSVCHVFKDRRAQEVVAATNGPTKVLLLMQSNCSPAARQMAGDLLKVFRAGFKSCLPSCEFQTAHVMPF